MKKNVFYLFLLSTILISCGDSDPITTINNNPESNNGGDNNNQGNNNNNTQEWLVPISDVIDGGPGKDGIPSIDDPSFISANAVTFLSNEDLVIGIVSGNDIRAYPHTILDWHEVVNDKINDEFITINYCPLTGTAFGWKSISAGSSSTFGVSGLLYNANLILYDRNTDSNWSQLRLQCINGDLIGSRPSLVHVVETNWGVWKSLYPNTQVLSLNTGFSRNYDEYPYGSYKTNHDYFIFPVSPLNDAIPNKERVFAIIDNPHSMVYQFSDFNGGKAIKSSFNGKDFLVVGTNEILVAFELNEDTSNLDFEYEFLNSGSFFKDNEGNKWSLFGEAIDGFRKGQKLVATKSVVSYWFAIAAFYPNPEIYNE